MSTESAVTTSRHVPVLPFGDAEGQTDSTTIGLLAAPQAALPRAAHDEQPALCVAVRAHYATHPTVVELAGEIDIVTAPYLRLLLGLPAGDVVMDLTRVTFLACAGLTELLRLRTHLHQTGAVLRLAGASPGIRRVITLTELQKLLPC